MTLFSKLMKKPAIESPRCSAVIAAAGLSQRIGGEDKLFIKIRGIPVLAYTLTAFQRCESISEIVVVSRKEKFECVNKICEQYGITKITKVIQTVWARCSLSNSQPEFLGKPLR